MIMTRVSAPGADLAVRGGGEEGVAGECEGGDVGGVGLEGGEGEVVGGWRMREWWLRGERRDGGKA